MLDDPAEVDPVTAGVPAIGVSGNLAPGAPDVGGAAGVDELVGSTVGVAPVLPVLRFGRVCAGVAAVGVAAVVAAGVAAGVDAVGVAAGVAAGVLPPLAVPPVADVAAGVAVVPPADLRLVTDLVRPVPDAGLPDPDVAVG